LPVVDLQSISLLAANPTNESLVTEASQLQVVVNALAASPIIALDVETSGLDYMRDQLHGVAAATRECEWYVCNGALLPFLAALRNLAQDQDKLVVMHNGKFDLHFLGRYGILPHRLADTMVAQWLVDENLELGLKKLAATRLGYNPDDLLEFKDLQKIMKKPLGVKKMDQVTIFDIPLDALSTYAARDARITFDLWHKLVYDLEVEGLTDHFWNIEMPYVWVLYEMEEAGMGIDPQRLNHVEAAWTQKAKEALACWNQLSGGVNPNSSKQLAAYLFGKLGLPSQGKTEKGQFSTDALVLQRLEPLDETGSVAALREYRRYDKLVSTYLGFLREKPYQGRVHGSFNQTGTVTGRLSSSDPNLQNIPARMELGTQMRQVFAAAPGKVLVVVDYSQIELRLLAHYSNEENFIRVFHEGGDPHQMTAELAAVDRYVGKTINFSWAYGAGPKKLADTIEKNGHPRPKETDTRVWLRSFDQAYPTLVRWKGRVIDHGRQLGYVKTILGRKRRLPDLHHHDDMLRSGAERQCVNAIIQGSAADLIKLAMLELRPWCWWFGARLLAQVHDELIFEVAADVAQEFAAVAQREMEWVRERFDLRVPVEAKPGLGPNWAEAKA